eukprot:5593730-Pleurochrysis_carterae.AAC.5
MASQLGWARTPVSSSTRGRADPPPPHRRYASQRQGQTAPGTVGSFLFRAGTYCTPPPRYDAYEQADDE